MSLKELFAAHVAAGRRVRARRGGRVGADVGARDAQARVRRLDRRLDRREAAGHRARRRDVQSRFDRGRSLREKCSVKSREVKENSGAARAGADAEHWSIRGRMAAAKAQPSAQDFAQSVPALSSLEATVAALFPAWPSHESPFAGSAFHAYLSMPWTRGTVIWLTMPLNASSKPASLHATWWYR